MAAGDWKDMLYAAERCDLELVKFHIEQGENPNYQHPEFLTTPLIESVRNGHEAVARYLLENGAKPRLAAGLSDLSFGLRNKVETPFTVAKQTKNKAMLQLLTEFDTQPTGFLRRLLLK